MKNFFGMLLAVSLMVFSLSVSSYAASAEKNDPAAGEGEVTGEARDNSFKWDIYGALIFDGFYTSSNQGDGIRVDNRKDGFEYGLLNMSYVGLNLSYGQFEAVIEVEPSLDALVNFLYGKYTFKNGGYLLVGQDVDIASYSFGQVSNAQNGLIDYGGINDTNRPMIKYGMHGFNIAVISPISVTTFDNDGSEAFLADTVSAANELVPEAEAEAFEWTPRFQLSYDIESDIFNGSVFGSYAFYILKTKNGSGNYQNNTLHSFHVGAGGQFDITDAFFIQAVGYYGMNMYLSSALTDESISPSISFGADNKVRIDNVQSAGGAIGFGYHINDMFTPQIGAGFASSWGGDIDRYDDKWGAYVNVVIEFNKWISLTPEIAYMDDLYDGKGNRQGSNIYAGAQIQVSF